MGLLGVTRANTAVGVSPETFLLLLLHCNQVRLLSQYCRASLLGIEHEQPLTTRGRAEQSIMQQQLVR
jgi:hypothetical protein